MNKTRTDLKQEILDRIDHIEMAADGARESKFVNYSYAELEAMAVMLRMTDEILMHKR
jgi:hypothetical protein